LLIKIIHKTSIPFIINQFRLGAFATDKQCCLDLNCDSTNHAFQSPRHPPEALASFNGVRNEDKLFIISILPYSTSKV